MELNITHTMDNDMEYSDNSSESKFLVSDENFSVIRVSEDVDMSAPKSSKHSSRKQSKRRKKSSSHSRPLPRIIVKPLPPPPPPDGREWTAATSLADISASTSKPSTMREVLASIPGFCLKPRKRSGKKLSTAAQLQQTKEGCIDLETPDSILVNTNIRQLLNKHTFSLLPPLYQYKLGQLLPSVDRPSTSGRLSSSSLNNEFFARACLEWQDGLSGGEFTPENQQKIKTEAEKEKSKIDPWKLKHFEPFWGDKIRKDKSSININSERPSLKTTIKLRPTASITSSSTVPKVKKSKSSSTSKRLRSVGAVTRSSTKTDDPLEESLAVNSKSTAPLPDLLPLKSAKSHNQGYVDCQVDFSFSDSSAQRLDDSVPSTPIDPLLLPDCDSETSEHKQDFILTIEESSTSKDCEEKLVESDSAQEATKRLSDDNVENIYVKRIKYEDDLVFEKLAEGDAFLSENCNDFGNEKCPDDGVNLHSNDQVVQSDDLNVYQEPDNDPPDTNSEDSKAAISLYEYDDRSVSSLSSLKNESNMNTMTSENTPSSLSEQSPIKEKVNHIEKEDSASDLQKIPMATDDILEVEYNESIVKASLKSEIHDGYAVPKYHSNEDISVKEDIDTKIEQNIESTDAKENDYEKVVTKEATEFESMPCKKETAVKCVDSRGVIENTTVHNFYDEHFKDAESLIMETGGLSLLSSRKHIFIS